MRRSLARPISPSRATISGMRLRGTAMSSPSLLRASRAMAGLTFRRASHSASDSSAVRAWRTSRAPERFSTSATTAISRCTRSASPSTATSSSASTSVGSPRCLKSSIARVVPLIHQLGHERDDAGLQDVADRRAGIRQPGEGGQRGQLRRGLGDQPHRDLGDDAQRALRPDEEPLEVVPGHVLDRPPAQPQHVPARQHDLQPQHVVAGDAVLQAARAARVGRHVAADRALVDAGRVGRVEEAELLDRAAADPG